WILIAVGGFVASVLFWNWLLIERMGADFKAPHVAISWIAAVFGTWFIILILLMQKKEKVMGHMDQDDEATVSWWLIWIGLTIGSFFLSVWFWTPFIAERLGSVKESANSLIWIVAVFGTWLIALTPLMIFMYKKVDQAYEKARIAREKRGETDRRTDSVKIKAVLIDPEKRKLPKHLSEELKKIPSTVKEGHLVTVTLKDGRKVENVFVAKRSELLGIYDQTELTFAANDIVAIEPTDLSHPPDFTQKSWLRFDGNAA
ncbi:MAG: hypothetical protein HY582_02360, partial [Candidatus Omnitrophica bacterium]|nr:hypothetical protein [Candidatus Omnitrophota bacterium]